MKTIIYSSIILAMLVITQEVNANPLQPSITNNTSSLALNAVSQDISAGGSNILKVDQEKPAASSAIAPSVGTGNDCQIATPSSVAGSVVIASASFTTGVTYNDICYAYKRGQFDVADKLMCMKSQDYAKANPTVCGGVK